MKKHIILIFSIFLLYSVLACDTVNTGEKEKVVTIAENQIQKEGLKKAYFASGCFWCVEAVFESVKGVKEAVSGYSGGEKVNPTYREISSGMLRHAEAVEVIYDPRKVDFETLVKVFFGSHDPTTLNQQGPDIGLQYRSIAFYTDDSEKEIIKNYIKKLSESSEYSSPIVTEVKEFEKFWIAEEYHQDYERLNPDIPYVRSVSVPRLNRFKTKFPELLKENH